MNAPLVQALQGMRADLASDNASAAHVQEERLDELLLSYIENKNKRFEFGGIVNLLRSVARVVEDKSRIEGDDYEKAAELIDDCADQCDLKYSEE